MESSKIKMGLSSIYEKIRLVIAEIVKIRVFLMHVTFVVYQMKKKKNI